MQRYSQSKLKHQIVSNPRASPLRRKSPRNGLFWTNKRYRNQIFAVKFKFRQEYSSTNQRKEHAHESMRGSMREWLLPIQEGYRGWK